MFFTIATTAQQLTETKLFSNPVHSAFVVQTKSQTGLRVPAPASSRQVVV